MNSYILIAGFVCLALGIVHSALGEYLIFKNWRAQGDVIPANGPAEIKERHVRIIWATWHLATVFGWCLGVLMIKIALDQQITNLPFVDSLIRLMAYTMFSASLLVLVGTKGRHPGWVVLLIIGLLLISAH